MSNYPINIYQLSIIIYSIVIWLDATSWWCQRKSQGIIIVLRVGLNGERCHMVWIRAHISVSPEWNLWCCIQLKKWQVTNKRALYRNRNSNPVSSLFTFTELNNHLLEQDVNVRLSVLESWTQPPLIWHQQGLMEPFNRPTTSEGVRFMDSSFGNHECLYKMLCTFFY